jgi:hypothetical protein
MSFGVKYPGESPRQVGARVAEAMKAADAARAESLAGSETHGPDGSENPIPASSESEEPKP